MVDWEANSFQKIKHERDHISWLNVFFHFPKLIESNKSESPVKGDWQWALCRKISDWTVCFYNLSLYLPNVDVLVSFMNRNHVSFDMGLMHDLVADGAHTVTFVWLRLKVLGVSPLNVSCSVIWQHLLHAVLTRPIHFWANGNLIIMTQKSIQKNKS